MSNKNTSEDKYYHQQIIVIILLRVVVSLTLLIAGIVILALRIPGWGIILGLPLIIFGSVFIIYTYDEVLSRQIMNHTHADFETKNNKSSNRDDEEKDY